MKSMESQIGEKLSEADALEQLAEESTELAQAALKLVQILRSEEDEQEAVAALREEYADVQVRAKVIGENFGMIHPDSIDNLRISKMARWIERLNQKGE